MDLHQENKQLRKKLEIAQSWMKREIESQSETLWKEWNSSHSHVSSVEKEIDEQVNQEILSFFADIPLSNIPEKLIEHLSQSELQYYLMQKWYHLDPLSVAIWYQKSIESLVEDCITRFFRSYGSKQKISASKQSDALDNSLQMVIDKWYTLSIGRLFHILSLIEDDMELTGYKKVFYDFLDTYVFIKNTLRDPEFFIQLRSVVESEVFSSKRHTGDVSFEEIIELRRICTGNFSDKNCLLYKLFETQNTL